MLKLITSHANDSKIVSYVDRKLIGLRRQTVTENIAVVLAMASSSTRLVVLNGYKSLLRTASHAFAQDVPALAAARVEIRSHFEQNKSETSAENISEQIRGISEVIDFLEQNVVQATLKPETGDYQIAFEDSHVEGFTKDGNPNQVHLMNNEEEYGIPNPVTTCSGGKPDPKKIVTSSHTEDKK